MIKEQHIDIRVAGYIRVSTSLQVKEGDSLKAQEETIRLFAERFGYTVIGIYKDEGISGKSVNRPELQRLRDDAMGGKFQKLLITKTDRFSRKLIDNLRLFDEFENIYKIPVISINEGGTDTTPVGQLSRMMLSVFADYEGTLIKERTQEGKIRKRKNKEIFLGNVPYGYIWNKMQKKLEVVPFEKEVYLKMVDQYLNKNMASTEIALQLNRSLIESPAGKK